MKPILFFVLFFLCFYSFSQISTISGIINSYIPVTNISTNNCSSVISVTYSGNFSAGDRILVIQMQGALIDSNNTGGFGEIIDYNNSGNYEFATINQISGNDISLEKKLINNYSISGVVQVVKVPHFTDAIVSGTLTCQPWNGLTGGILAIEVDDSLILNADIDVSGKGFRGGTISLTSTGPYLWCGSNFYYSYASKNGGKKGEGISLYHLNREAGRGKNCNGGGGGNDHNSGGAGGGNFGSGGAGGAWKGAISNPTCIIGGIGGLNLVYSNDSNKIFLGGGGGGPHQNNMHGTDGKNGGGLIIIRAAQVDGQDNLIKSEGLSQSVVASDDGAGGGGAGGTVLIEANEIKNVAIKVNGGNGGNNNYYYSTAVCVAPGGGGGGGVVWINGDTSNVILTVSGGQAGIVTNAQSPCYMQSFEATAGQDGSLLTGLNIPEGTISGNISVDLGLDTTIFFLYSLTLDAGPGYSEYIWSTGDSSQTLLVNDSLFGLGMHLFYVKVTDSEGCYGIDSVFVTITKDLVNVVSIEENEKCVFPVPFWNDLNLSFKYDDLETVDFFNIDGRNILHVKYSEKLDLSELKPGFYILQINRKNNSSIYFKVLKK